MDSIRGTIQAIQHASRNTQDCETICNQTIQYCLIMGGSHTEPSHLQMMQDCADICQVTARLISRGSPRHREITAACAAVCDQCARDCEKFVGDPHMKACANQCYLCATACRQMLSATAGAGENALRDSVAPMGGMQGMPGMPGMQRGTPL